MTSIDDNGAPLPNVPRTNTSRLTAALVVLAGFVLIGAHLLVLRNYYGASGALLILDHGFDLLATLTLLLVCSAVGLHCLVRLRLPVSGAEELLFGTVCGMGVVGTALLCLGLTIGWAPPAQVALFIALGWLARPGFQRIRAMLRHAASPGNHRLDLICCAVTILPALGAMLIFATAPPIDYDSLAYHLQVPRQWLEAGRIYTPLDSQHSAVAGIIQLLYVPLLAVGSLAGPALLNVALATLLGAGTYLCALRFYGRGVALWSSLLLWASTILISVAASPKVDVSLALFLFAAQYALLLALAHPSSGLPILAGVVVGLAIGVKLVALPFVLGLLPIAFWALPLSRDNNRPGPTLMGFAVAALLAASPWLIKNWLLSGTALYPMGTGGALPPWLEQLKGALPPPSATREELAVSTRSSINLLDLVFYPGRLTPESEGAGYHFNALFMALPLAALVARGKITAALIAPPAIFLTLLFARNPQLNLRYLIPAIPVFTIVSGAALWRALRPVRRFQAGAIMATASLAVLTPTIMTVGKRAVDTGALRHVVGHESRGEYLRSATPEVALLLAISDSLNRLLPPDSRTLFLFEERAFYLTRDVIRDNWLINWPTLAGSTAADGCLRDLGITNVVVNGSTLEYFVRRGLNAELVKWPEFLVFAQRCLEPLTVRPDFVLYKVRPEALEQP